MSIPYGYCKGEDSKGRVNPEEAKWVKLIWQWRAERVTMGEIRRRLIEGNAPQRHSDWSKFKWQHKRIANILRNPVYHTGIQPIQWSGNTFEIRYPVLVDAETARKVREIIAQGQTYPARHIKHDYLTMGLTHCAVCGSVMTAYTTWQYSNGKRRDVLVREYRCSNYVHGNRLAGCARYAHVAKVDAELWRKVNVALSDDNDFEDRVQTRVTELKRTEADAEGSIERIKHELGRIEEERQWVITQARKKSITEADMDKQTRRARRTSARIAAGTCG
jgi:hypothetical protein